MNEGNEIKKKTERREKRQREKHRNKSQGERDGGIKIKLQDKRMFYMQRDKV